MCRNDAFSEYPEHPLNTRIKLAYDWISNDTNTLLDGGCAWGYGTHHYRKKCNSVYGIEFRKDFVRTAKQRYPDINFTRGGLETCPFRSNYFDVVILTDVLEHVTYEKQALNEIYRIIKSESVLIITTPYKGLFSFLDPENYKFYLRKRINWLYKLITKLKKVDTSEKLLQSYENKHKHYSLSDFTAMLNGSKFKNNYEIVKIFRSGLFVQVFTSNLEFILNYIVGKKISSVLIKPFQLLSRIDYWIPYLMFSYNIAIKICVDKNNN